MLWSANQPEEATTVMSAIERIKQWMDSLGFRPQVRSRSADPSRMPPTEAAVGVKVTADRTYGGGYTDEQLEKWAVEEGHASYHDRSVWGENTEPRTIYAVNAAVEVQRDLVAHAYAEDSADLERQLEDAMPRAKLTGQQVLEDIGKEEEARVEAERLAGETRRQGLVRPHRGDARRYLLKLAALALGDMAFISVSFQVFGLSDGLAFGFVPYSSDLHIAALSSVLALLYLAHHSGEGIATLAHRRRLHRDGDRVTAPLAVEDYGAPVVWIAGALMVIVGVAAVREVYLVSLGVEAHSWAFVLIQGGVLLAALALSTSHAHPLTREWERVSRHVSKATRRALQSSEQHADLVARVNRLIDTREALFAMAVRHMRLAGHDAQRQSQVYARRVQLSQPEPVHERLFPEELPRPAEPSDEELAKDLTATGDGPEFDRLGLEEIEARREQLRRAVEELRKQGSGSPFGAASGDGAAGSEAAVTTARNGTGA